MGFAATTACDGNSTPLSQLTHPSLAAIDSVPVGGSPYGVALNIAGETWISGLDGTLHVDPDLPVDSLPSISIGFTSEARHIVFNPAGTRAYVTLQSGQAMAVINVVSRSVVTTVPLGHDGFNLITSRDGSQVFVSTDAGLDYTVDAGTNQITDSIALGPAVNGFARHPKLPRIYISSRDSGAVSEVDVGSHAVLRTFHTGGQPQRLAVSPDGHGLLIANENLGLDIWNLSTGLRDTTMLNTARNVAFDPTGDAAVITNQAGFVTVVR